MSFVAASIDAKNTLAKMEMAKILEKPNFHAFKIVEHRVRYLEQVPDSNLIPMHYFLEHDPQLMQNFGPLVSLRTRSSHQKPYCESLVPVVV